MNVAIIGASGYTGLELIKILLTHPKFNITYIANSTGDINVQELHPCLKDVFRFTDYYSTRYRIFLYTVYQVAGIYCLMVPGIYTYQPFTIGIT